MGRAAAGAAAHRGTARARPGATRRPVPRRRSGPPHEIPAALPLRLLRAPFARAARVRAGRALDALLAGRGWIALVGLLLAGIVFFNVGLLERGRGIARTAERTSQVKRENARLRLELARLASSERIQRVAALRGLVLPAPGEVRYLRANPSVDARRAARHMPEQAPSAAAPAPGAAG